MRAVKRRYGLAGRQVAIRTHVPWYWRGLFAVLVLTFGIALAWWVYARGNYITGLVSGGNGQDVGALSDKFKQLEADNVRLRAAQLTTDRHNLIDNAAQQDTERALKLLQDENAQLKEELAIFRGISSGDRATGMNIFRFKVERAGAGVYRYQLLLVQAGQGDKVFKGRLQLAVTTQEGGKNIVRIFPANALAKSNFIVSVKSYQKLEGDLQLPSTSMVKSVEARIFGEGATQPKLIKTVNLS